MFMMRQRGTSSMVWLNAARRVCMSTSSLSMNRHIATTSPSSMPLHTAKNVHIHHYHRHAGAGVSTAFMRHQQQHHGKCILNRWSSSDNDEIEEEDKRLVESAALPSKGEYVNDTTDNSNVLELIETIGRENSLSLDDVTELLSSQHGRDIRVYVGDNDRSTFVDYCIIVSGRSPRHITALAEVVAKAMRKHLDDLVSGRNSIDSDLNFKYKCGPPSTRGGLKGGGLHQKLRSKNPVTVRIEGTGDDEWMCVDLGNIIVHVFTPEARDHFQLDSLWNDKSTDLEGNNNSDRYANTTWSQRSQRGHRKLVLNEVNKE